MRVRNCVRVGPVRCYFTGSKCRRKHSKHSGQAASGFSLRRYGTYFSCTYQCVLPILFYPRAHHRRYLIIVLFSVMTLIGVNIEIEDRCIGIRNKLSVHFGMFRLRELDFTDFTVSRNETVYNFRELRNRTRLTFEKPLVVLNWMSFSTLL